jgi:benzoyl-CoA reductase subunit C
MLGCILPVKIAEGAVSGAKRISERRREMVTQVRSKAKPRSKALESFHQATQTLANPAVREWKSQGKKVIGYFCSYVPEEIITAAGFLPFRIRATGSKETTLGDAYFGINNCTFTRHCLDSAFRGNYNFLDGVVWASTCDHIRRVYDVWKAKIGGAFLHYLSVPRKVGEPQAEWYAEELALFRQSLEKHFSVKISNEALWQAIKLHNGTRRLQRRVYELRKLKAPPLTGAEVLAITVASTAMPKKEYNQLLEQLLGEVSSWEGHSDYRARLMLLGGILDDPAYVEVIEGQGGLVVADMLCFGSRIMWQDVDEKASDPIAALARFHIGTRPSCPRMWGDHPQRAALAKDMIKSFQVDGVICSPMKFCDFWGGEAFMLTQDLKRDGVPVLTVEREYLLSAVGQLRTRVQAFLETIER